MINHGYITLAELKAVLRDNQSTYDAAYERAIETASRQIDRYCGTHFWKVTSPQPRVFRPERSGVLYTGDFANTTGLIVRTDEDGDGVYETLWPSADYQVEPLTPIDGRPFNRIRALNGRGFTLPFFWPTQRAHVQVTANWGWDAIPPQVAMACQILAIELFKSKDLTGGSAGVAELAAGNFGSLRFNGIKVSRFNPLAESLLMGLRTPTMG